MDKGGMNLDVMKNYWPHWSMNLHVSPQGTTCIIYIPSMQFYGWGDTIEQAVEQAKEKVSAYVVELEARL